MANLTWGDRVGRAPLPATGQKVGVDVGLKTFATFSTSEEIANPRFFSYEERALAKSIHDAAWSQFTSLLSYKAAWAGRTYVAMNPAYTSQDCSRCGHRHKALPLCPHLHLPVLRVGDRPRS
ncbi:MAG: zinc ribbon domain-containing protein [Ktedonobacterales bacterium]